MQFLSNGEKFCINCYRNTEKKRIETESDIDLKNNLLDEYELKIKKEESIFRSITGIFIRKREENLDFLYSQVEVLEREINELENTLEEIYEYLNHLYDYWGSYPPDWEERRKEVIDRAGSRCESCHWRTGSDVHHIWEISKGGSNKIENLQLLCSQCHQKQHPHRLKYNGEKNDPMKEGRFVKKMKLINEAIENEKNLRFVYNKPREESTKRTIIPQEIVEIETRLGGVSMCLKSFCLLREDERVFAIRRMEKVKIIERSKSR